jgi:hypothetical protein
VRERAKAFHRIPAPAASYLDGELGLGGEPNPCHAEVSIRALSSAASLAMSRLNGAMAAAAAALAASVGSGTPASAASARAPDPKKVQAEHNVLRFLQQDLGRRWILRHGGGRRLYQRLFDPRTQLLRNNTQVRCLRSRNPHRRGRYFCVIRPGQHRRHEGLHVRYLRLGDAYFRIKWLFYRRGS